MTLRRSDRRRAFRPLALAATTAFALLPTLGGCGGSTAPAGRDPVPEATEVVAEARTADAILRVRAGGALETGVALTLHVEADARPGDRVEALLAERPASEAIDDDPATPGDAAAPSARWTGFDRGVGDRVDFGGFELLELGATTIAPLPSADRALGEDVVRRTIPMRIASFRPGDVRLPALRVRRGERVLAELEPTALAIASALDVPLEEAVSRDVVDAAPPDALAIDVPVASRLGTGAIVVACTIALAVIAAAITALLLFRGRDPRRIDPAGARPDARARLAEARVHLDAGRLRAALDAAEAALRAIDEAADDRDVDDEPSRRARTSVAERALLGADVERARFAHAPDAGATRALVERTATLVDAAAPTTRAEVAA